MKMIALNNAGNAHGILEDTDGMAAWIDGNKVTTIDWFVYMGVKNGLLKPANLVGIQNVMARAAAMAELEAWDTVEKTATVLHKSKRGTLLEMTWLEQKLLRVVCPSTKKVYYLGVPKATRTVDEAQAFVNKEKGEFDVES